MKTSTFGKKKNLTEHGKDIVEMINENKQFWGKKTLTEHGKDIAKMITLKTTTFGGNSHRALKGQNTFG